MSDIKNTNALFTTVQVRLTADGTVLKTHADLLVHLLKKKGIECPVEAAGELVTELEAALKEWPLETAAQPATTPRTPTPRRRSSAPPVPAPGESPAPEAGASQPAAPPASVPPPVAPVPAPAPQESPVLPLGDVPPPAQPPAPVIPPPVADPTSPPPPLPAAGTVAGIPTIPPNNAFPADREL